MKVLRYAAFQYDHDDALTHLWHVEREDLHYLLSFKGGGSLSYGAKATGDEATVSQAFNQEQANLESGTYHNEQWVIVSETMDAEAKKRLNIFEHPNFGIKWDKEVGMPTEEVQFCDMLEKQVKEWKGTSHGMPVARHPYWPTFHAKVMDAVAKEYGESVRLYRGIHGEQAPKILAGEPVKMFRFSSWTSDLQSARVYAAGKTKRGNRDWVVIQKNFTPEEIAFAPVTLAEPCENPDILMRLMHDVEHYGDEFIVNLSELIPGDYKIAAKPRGKKNELLIREYIQELLIRIL